MAKKKSPINKAGIGHNGTPFSRERYAEIEAMLKGDPDTAFVWSMFVGVYNPVVIHAYREMLETQKFFVELLASAREKFTGELDKEDLNLAEEMTAWIKSLQGTTTAILEMRQSLLSKEQADEIEGSVDAKSSNISIADEFAAKARKGGSK
jgi:hypothetical protein